MEEIDSKNESSLKLHQMSERQAILYLEKGGTDLLNPKNSESRTELLDYHKYYLFKKKQREKELPKEKLEERRRLYQLSLKEYTPILLHQKWKKFSELNIKVELKMSFLVAKKNALIELYI